MSSFQIKLVAVISMLIDHIGLFFFPQVPIYRIIGRIAFPLFSFLIANGARNTRNIYRYLGTLFSFALVSQIPYLLANDKINLPPNKLNILFTLSLGLLVIIIIRKYKNKLIWLVTLVLASFIAYILNFDYQIVGVLSIVGFYLFFDKPVKMIILQTSLFVLPIIYYTMYFYPKNILQIIFENMYFAPFALLALIFIFLFNGKEGPKLKYVFYVIYPLQYVVFYLVLSLT